MSSDKTTPPTEDNKVEINFDGKFLSVRAPITIGKLGVYGALQMGLELAGRIFFDMERQAMEAQRKGQSILQKLHIIGRK